MSWPLLDIFPEETRIQKGDALAVHGSTVYKMPSSCTCWACRKGWLESVGPRQRCISPPFPPLPSPVFFLFPSLLFSLSLTLPSSDFSTCALAFFHNRWLRKVRCLNSAWLPLEETFQWRRYQNAQVETERLLRT